MQASTNTHARIVGDHLDAASILEDFFVRLCHSPVPLSVGDPPMDPSSCYWTTTEHGGSLVVLRQLHLTPPKPRRYNVVAHPSLSSLVSTALLLALST